MRSVRPPELYEEKPPKRSFSPLSMDEALYPYDDTELKNEMRLIEKFFFLNLMRDNPSFKKDHVTLEFKEICTLNKMDESVVCSITYFDPVYKQSLLNSISTETLEDIIKRYQDEEKKLVDYFEKLNPSGIDIDLKYIIVVISCCRKLLTVAEFNYQLATQCNENLFGDFLALKKIEKSMLVKVKTILKAFSLLHPCIIKNFNKNEKDKKIMRDAMNRIFSICKTLQHSTLLSTIKCVKRFFKTSEFLHILKEFYTAQYIGLQASDLSVNCNYFRQIAGELWHDQLVRYNQLGENVKKHHSFGLSVILLTVCSGNSLGLSQNSPLTLINFVIAFQYLKQSFNFLALCIDCLLDNENISQRWAVISEDGLYDCTPLKRDLIIKELNGRVEILNSLVEQTERLLKRFMWDIIQQNLQPDSELGIKLKLKLQEIEGELLILDTKMQTYKIKFNEKKQEIAERNNEFHDKNQKQPSKPQQVVPTTAKLALLPCAENPIKTASLVSSCFFGKTPTISEEEQKEHAEMRKARYEQIKSQEKSCTLVVAHEVTHEEKKYENFCRLFNCIPIIDEEACLRTPHSQRIASRFPEAKGVFENILEHPRPGYNVVFLSESKNGGCSGFKLRPMGANGLGDLRLKGNLDNLDNLDNGKSVVRFTRFGTHKTI